MLKRREAIATLMANRPKDLFVVPGLGSCTYDMASLGEKDSDFYLWGAMGGAAMIGLGLALAKPKLKVAVITGDGEMLMGMGSLATIGVQRPKNLAVIVFDNQRYGETGMQASHTDNGVDLVGVAKSCGIAHAFEVRGRGGAEEARGRAGGAQRDAVRARAHRGGRSAARAAHQGRRGTEAALPQGGRGGGVGAFVSSAHSRASGNPGPKTGSPFRGDERTGRKAPFSLAGQAGTEPL